MIALPDEASDCFAFLLSAKAEFDKIVRSPYTALMKLASSVLYTAEYWL